MGLDNMPDILSVRQLADFLQVNEQTIKRAIKAGELKAFKVSRDWRIERESVIEWLKQK